MGSLLPLLLAFGILKLMSVCGIIIAVPAIIILFIRGQCDFLLRKTHMGRYENRKVRICP
jgi:hypothetical protein